MQLIFCNFGFFLFLAILINSQATKATISYKSSDVTPVDSHLYRFNLRRWDLKSLKDDGVSGPFDLIGEHKIFFISRCGLISIFQRNKGQMGLIQQKKLPFHDEVLCQDRQNTKTTGVKDLLIEPLNDNRLTVYISYLTGITTCPKLRIDRLHLKIAKTIVFQDRKKLFETSKCPKEPIVYTQSGGAMAAGAENIYFNVGDFGYMDSPEFPEHGTIFSIEKRPPFNRRKIARGIRNSEGLTVVDKDSYFPYIVFSDMGPKGGDEVNMLNSKDLLIWSWFKNIDFGFSRASYGIAYDHDILKDNKPVFDNHSKGKKPEYVYVPSIAPTAIKHYTKFLFKNWKDSLFMTSLRAKTIFRLKVDDRKIIYSEPLVNTGERMRFLQIGSDGTIYAKADPDILFSIEKIETNMVFNPQNFIAANKCFSCHSLKSNGSVPDLTQLTSEQITKKLNAYSTGLLKNPIMNGLTRNLSKQQIKAVSLEIGKSGPNKLK